MPILSISDPVEVLGTMEIVEHLTGIWKQRLHVFPNPIRSITNDTKSDRLFRNQSRLFESLEGFAQIVFALHLVPAHEMNDVVPVQQVKPKTLDLAILSLPSGSPGPLAS